MSKILKIVSFVLVFFSFFYTWYSDDITAERLINRGLFFEKRWDLDKAEKYFNDALEKDPLSQDAFDGITRITTLKFPWDAIDVSWETDTENISEDESKEDKNIIDMFSDNYKLFILPTVALVIWWFFLIYINKKVPSKKKLDNELDDIF